MEDFKTSVKRFLYTYIRFSPKVYLMVQSMFLLTMGLAHLLSVVMPNMDPVPGIPLLLHHHTHIHHGEGQNDDRVNPKEYVMAWHGASLVFMGLAGVFMASNAPVDLQRRFVSVYIVHWLIAAVLAAKGLYQSSSTVMAIYISMEMVWSSMVWHTGGEPLFSFEDKKRPLDADEYPKKVLGRVPPAVANKLDFQSLEPLKKRLKVDEHDKKKEGVKPAAIASEQLRERLLHDMDAAAMDKDQ